MNEAIALAFLQSSGYQADSIRFIPEGISHDIFEARLDSGQEIIARFEKKNQHVDGQRRDFHFNSPLSLEREAYLCTSGKKSRAASSLNLRYKRILWKKMPYC